MSNRKHSKKTKVLKKKDAKNKRKSSKILHKHLMKKKISRKIKNKKEKRALLVKSKQKIKNKQRKIRMRAKTKEGKAKQKNYPIKKIKVYKKRDLLKKRKKEEEKMYKMKVGKVIEDITNNNNVMEYLRKNVSKSTEEVIKVLRSTKTDEQIAEELGIKINTVRRILNILHGYGITNYTTIKNSKGWLSFLWSINLKKIDDFYNYLNKEEISVSLINESSDDYFICSKCYSENKLIFDFDSAFEAEFKCSICGNKLKRLNREEAKKVEEAESIEILNSHH